METEFAGPPLPPQFVQRFLLMGTRHNLKRFQLQNPRNTRTNEKHKSRAKYVTSSSCSGESEVSVQVKKSLKSKGDSSEQNKPNLDPDPVFYREVDMSGLSSQYTEDIKTFSQILKLPDPLDHMPMSCTTVWCLNNIASQQEFRPKGPSAMLPVSPRLKEALDKVEQYFQAANLPEHRFIKPPPFTSKWYKLGQLCFKTSYKN